MARRRTENSIDWAVVITELAQFCLNGLDRAISRRFISGRGVIVRLSASVVSVRIVTSGRGVILRLNVRVVVVRVGVVIVRIGVVIFCFNDTAATEIYTLSLHDALPRCLRTIAPSVLQAS